MIMEKAQAEMTPRDVTKLQEIIAKDNNSILPSERELLNARQSYLDDDEKMKFGIIAANSYGELKFNELKAEAKNRGIILDKSAKADEIIALLEEYDNLKDGDEFQGKTAHFATQEMIDENGLGEDLKIGDLFFTNENENKDDEEKE